MDKLDEKIKKVYDHLLRDYNDNYAIHCGSNGPYDDPETKVRNLCNLIIATCICAIDDKSSINFQNIIERMQEELFSYETGDGLFIIRNKIKKDGCNGVLGHAWVIEALVYLYLYSKNNEFLDKAIAIYRAHEFDSHLGLWKCPVRFGGTIDMTINHQIWFAGIASELGVFSKAGDVLDDLKIFGEKFWKNAKVHRNGLFLHYVQPQNVTGVLKKLIRNTDDTIRFLLRLPSMRYKENGYHLFCLSGLARLKMSNSCDIIFAQDRLSRALSYCNTQSYLHSLVDTNHFKDISTLTKKEHFSSIRCNIYGYPYNAPGLEVKFVAEVLGGIHNATIENLRMNQSNLTYNQGTTLFDLNTMDSVDLSYKVYEGMISKNQFINQEEVVD